MKNSLCRFMVQRNIWYDPVILLVSSSLPINKLVTGSSNMCCNMSVRIFSVQYKHTGIFLFWLMKPV